MRLYALDTETGGFKEKEHALLSIALVEITTNGAADRREIELFCLPDAGKIITDEAAAVNGYTPEKWKERGALPLQHQLLAMGCWLYGQQTEENKNEPVEQIGIVAHNASFDKRFMVAFEDAHCVPITKLVPWFCSLEKFRAICKQRRWFPPNHKLDSLAHMCGHWAPGYVRGDHGALADARAAAAAWPWLHDPAAKFVPFANPTAPIIGR